MLVLDPPGRSSLPLVAPPAYAATGAASGPQWSVVIRLAIPRLRVCAASLGRCNSSKDGTSIYVNQ